MRPRRRRRGHGRRRRRRRAGVQGQQGRVRRIRKNTPTLPLFAAPEPSLTLEHNYKPHKYFLEFFPAYSRPKKRFIRIFERNLRKRCRKSKKKKFLQKRRKIYLLKCLFPWQIS